MPLASELLSRRSSAIPSRRRLDCPAGPPLPSGEDHGLASTPAGGNRCPRSSTSYPFGRILESGTIIGERRRIVEFSLQLEVEVEGIWRQVIRYDTAHGFAHVDRFTLTGRRKKERVHLEYAEALTRAERDLKQNWFAYRERFLKGGFP